MDNREPRWISFFFVLGSRFPVTFPNPMSTAEFDHLVATWADQSTGTVCAAVAERYRKEGRLPDALSLADECVHRWPEYLPGHLVRGLTIRDQGDLSAADAALLAALAIDPSHPVVLEELAHIAELRGARADASAWQQLRDASAEPAPPGLPGFLASPAYQDSVADMHRFDGSFEEDFEEPSDELLTESLAALYQAQGHLERAAEVYSVLASRTPDNPTLAQRRDAIQEEMARSRPRPYDARQSGGAPLGRWLRTIAIGRPQSDATPRGGYDAFYQTAPVREPTEDLAAFQNWLKGLGR